MLRTATRHLREQFRLRSELIPVGITWAALITVDATEVGGGVIAILQRPTADLPVALAAFAVCISPTLMFFFLNMKLSPLLMWATWSTATVMMLFGTPTPIHADFAPALMVLMVLSVTTLSSVAAGLLSAASATALLLASRRRLISRFTASPKNP